MSPNGDGVCTSDNSMSPPSVLILPLVLFYGRASVCSPNPVGVIAMKKLPLLALLLLTSCIPVLAQDDYRPNQEADRQSITNLEQGFAHAIQLNNSTIFNTVFSDDFTGITYYGEVINKAKQ